MPVIKRNKLVRGASGNMAKEYVYKQRGNKTFIADMPQINPNLQPTEDQKNLRKRFAAAVRYAKGAVTDPALKKEYKKKAAPGQTAVNVAFKDFFNAPVVDKIDVSQYTGAIGSKIIVEAHDDFRVAQVKVAIATSDGTIVEEGMALLNPVNLYQWIYTATLLNNSRIGGIVTATARDLPGNEASLDANL